MLYELARIILPTAQYLNNSNLFLNKATSCCEIDNTLCDTVVYKFNTWMNIFPAKKYHVYSVIDDLFLQIKINVDSEILIYGFNYSEALHSEELIYQGKLNKNIEQAIEINDFEKFENIYFEIVSSSSELNLEKASWVTSRAPVRTSKLALITCTFKRENFVYKNVNLFKTFINNNQSLKNRIKFYVVDNGKTISSEIQDDNVSLFPNKNAGGAGGFTRGIIEAKNSTEKFTRILLMDDDVEVFPEAFYRTIVLCDYLKDEYKNSFIHGAMLNLYKRNVFFESTAIKTDNWCYSYHGKLDISNVKDIAKANWTSNEIFKNKDIKVSSAWWYCCFSMESVINKGLPLPVFFRCDDMEWSLRNSEEHHITMNGISVWHLPFEWRGSKPVDWYFSKRNFIMINMIHTEYYKNAMLKMLKKDFKRLLKTCDYSSCAIYLRMMNDVLLGSESFRKDPEILLKEVFAYIKDDKLSDISELTIIHQLNKKYQKYKLEKENYKKKLNILKRFIYVLTISAKLIPDFLLKSEKNTWESAPSDEFIFCRKLNIYNLATNKIETRIYSLQKAKKLQDEFNKAYKKLDEKYEIIKNDFKNSYKEFITEEFWNKYLSLNTLEKHL